MTATTKPGYTVTLTADTEVVMTRTFDAPRELVFRAHTDPALVAQWWGLRNTTTEVDQLEARPGGPWRFVQHAADGTQHAFRGEFREIVPPERFTWTFEYEGYPGAIILETFRFEEHDGKTTLTSTAYYGNREARDGMLASGMESGANESAARLDELLERLQAA